MYGHLIVKQSLKIRSACQDMGHFNKPYEIKCKISSCRIFIKMFNFLVLNLNLP